MKTPSMTIYMKPECAQDQGIARKIRADLEWTTLRSVATVTEKYYDPDIDHPCITQDSDMVEEYWAMPDVDIDKGALSHWVLRISLDKRALSTREIELSSIRRKIMELSSELFVIATDETEMKPRLRVRIKRIEGDDGDEEDEYRNLVDVEKLLLDHVELKGKKGINRVQF